MRCKYPRVVRFEFEDGPRWAVQVSRHKYRNTEDLKDMDWRYFGNLVHNTKEAACLVKSRIEARRNPVVEECATSSRQCKGLWWYWIAHVLVAAIAVLWVLNS